MPKLPVVTPHDLIRALTKLGFFEHRQRGTSHLVMKHTDGRRAIIAVHHGRDIPKGTLSGILKDIGVTPEQLRDLL